MIPWNSQSGGDALFLNVMGWLVDVEWCVRHGCARNSKAKTRAPHANRTVSRSCAVLPLSQVPSSRNWAYKIQWKNQEIQKKTVLLKTIVWAPFRMVLTSFNTARMLGIIFRIDLAISKTPVNFTKHLNTSIIWFFSICNYSCYFQPSNYRFVHGNGKAQSRKALKNKHRALNRIQRVV